VLSARVTREPAFDTYLPTKFSSTELLPALWPPTTAIWGRSSCICTPSCVNASCSLFTIGINCSIPVLPAILPPGSRKPRYTAWSYTRTIVSSFLYTHARARTFCRFAFVFLALTAMRDPADHRLELLLCHRPTRVADGRENDYPLRSPSVH